jgi:hypothetical protein
VEHRPGDGQQTLVLVLSFWHEYTLFKLQAFVQTSKHLCCRADTNRRSLSGESERRSSNLGQVRSNA